MIIKYENDTPTIFDTVIDGGATSPIDAILINKVMSASFPIFNLETEKDGGVLQYKAGEFGGTLSFMQTETSYYGNDLNTFFRGGTRAYKYWIAIEIGGSVFHGTFETSDIDFDFTYSQGKYELTFITRDTIKEYAKYLNTFNSYFSISTSQNISFESYIADYHLQFLNVNFIGATLSSRVGVNTFFSGSAYVNGIHAGTDTRKISRLESFKELAKGLGFVYYLTVNRTLQSIYENPSNWYARAFIDMNIDWVWDGSGVYSNTMTIDKAIIHQEKILPKAARYIMIQYRHIISTTFPGFDEIDFTASRGILSDGTTVLQSDSIDNFNPIYAHYPFFYFPPSGGVAPDGNWVSDEQFAFYDRRYPYPERPPIFNFSDVNFVELNLYNYTSLGGGTVPGSCAYARLFNTTTGFQPLQNFVLNQYSRYILGKGKKVKTVKIILESDTDVKLYKPVLLTDDQGEGVYYISKISNLDYFQRDVTLELTQI